MLSWICPECGRECGFREKECFSCVPAAGQSCIRALWASVQDSGTRLLPAPRPLLLLNAPAAYPMASSVRAWASGFAPVAAPNRSHPIAGPLLQPCRMWVPGFSDEHVPARPSAFNAVRPEQPRASAGVPGWLIATVTVTAVLLGLGLLTRQLSSQPEAKSAASQAPALASAAPTPLLVDGKPSPVAPSIVEEPAYPFAKFVEVTGLRVVVDLNHRSQVQYVVVNHSATPLTDLALKIAVRSAVAATGADVLFTVAARVPVLGPHESKEIRTDLDSELRSAAIPDWENLRTDIQVTSQQ